MKTAIFLLALVGMSQAAVLVQPKALKEKTRSLPDDLQDFLDLLPADEILNILIDNLGDPQVQQVLLYLFSEEFAKLVIEIEQIPEFKLVVAYLESTGLPVSEWIEVLKDFLGIAKLGVRKVSSRDLNSVIDEIMSILPVEEIKKLYDYKIKNSPEFAELINKLNSPILKRLIELLAANPEIQRIGETLKDMGVDIDALVDLIKAIFGLN